MKRFGFWKVSCPISHTLSVESLFDWKIPFWMFDGRCKARLEFQQQTIKELETILTSYRGE